MYVQLRVQQHATLHLEILTTHEQAIRVTVSTLYASDRARFLGTSLRCVYSIHLAYLSHPFDFDFVF